MGTNYYATPKADDKTKESIIKAIQLDRLALAKAMIPDRVHIGKSSAGWPFLFNHNDWIYFESFEGLKSWLGNCEIEDEYGSDINYKDFLDMVENKQDKIGMCKKPDWYIHRDGYVFSTSTDFC